MYSQGCGGSSPPLGTKVFSLVFGLPITRQTASNCRQQSSVSPISFKVAQARGQSWSPISHRDIGKGTMSTQLDQILAHTLLQVKARKVVADFGLLERKAY